MAWKDLPPEEREETKADFIAYVVFPVVAALFVAAWFYFMRTG